MKRPISPNQIATRIFFIRGQRVMLDFDLAGLYDVATKQLNLAVRRNRARFPADFMFQLTRKEAIFLRFQIETSKRGSGGRRYHPYVFTEQGIAMLSGVLNSGRAIRVNIAIMRAFVKLRDVLSAHKELARQLIALENKYDARFRVVFDAIRKLMAPKPLPPPPPHRRIGFQIGIAQDSGSEKSRCR